MPREIPTSSDWNLRPSVDSPWEQPRESDPIIPNSWDPRDEVKNSWKQPRLQYMWGVTLDSSMITLDQISYTLDNDNSFIDEISQWVTERYAHILLNNRAQKILNNFGNRLLLNGIEESNVIQSNWV